MSVKSDILSFNSAGSVSLKATTVRAEEELAPCFIQRSVSKHGRDTGADSAPGYDDDDDEDDGDDGETGHSAAERCGNMALNAALQQLPGGAPACRSASRRGPVPVGHAEEEEEDDSMEFIIDCVLIPIMSAVIPSVHSVHSVHSSTAPPTAARQEVLSEPWPRFFPRQSLIWNS
ncbi:uncharacterized protein V6R79_009417 [Siganus canaliculatus]